jgi:hypothetical protein
MMCSEQVAGICCSKDQADLVNSEFASIAIDCPLEDACT